MRRIWIVAIALFVLCSQEVVFADDVNVEQGLINAMRLKKDTTDRIGNSGAAIQSYVKEGYLDTKPNSRADYTDYWVLKKPSSLMGHTLVLIENEYMAQYVGCCVNPGVGVTVKISGSTRKLEKFANENGCTFTNRVNAQEIFKNFGIKTNLPEGKYASLSCRQLDVNQ